jgi:hypothetical protein
MKRSVTIALLIVVGAVCLHMRPTANATQPPSASEEAPSRLCVVWTSGDPDVARNVCFMYTGAAKSSRWFDEVHLVVWGPSAKLLSEDKELQKIVAGMQKRGVVVEACIVCANRYGVSDDLRKLGIDVKGMGAPLTNRLKGDWKVITF